MKLIVEEQEGSGVSKTLIYTICGPRISREQPAPLLPNFLKPIFEIFGIVKKITACFTF